ncbi:MAG: hypothetical protein HYU42_06635 [Candidatus Rokubacteria bacterium]|nr:hypothetical protein [Candidatus Rokubacteria bacterium]
MPHYLHLLKADSGPLAAPVMESAGREPESVMKLGDTPADYSRLLDLIFASDRVVVW